MIGKDEEKIVKKEEVGSLDILRMGEEQLTLLKKKASMLLGTGFLPYAVKTPEQVIALMVKGHELGIPPMQALAQLYVVSGKVGMAAELMRALIMERLPGARIIVKEMTEERCLLAVRRPEWKEGEYNEYSYTWQEAQNAGIHLDSNGKVKPNWKGYRKSMLFARATAIAGRADFADLLRGVSYTKEELEDIQVEATRDVTPQQEQLPEQAENAKGTGELTGFAKLQQAMDPVAKRMLDENKDGEVVDAEFIETDSVDKKETVEPVKEDPKKEAPKEEKPKKAEPKKEKAKKETLEEQDSSEDKQDMCSTAQLKAIKKLTGITDEEELGQYIIKNYFNDRETTFTGNFDTLTYSLAGWIIALLQEKK